MKTPPVMVIKDTADNDILIAKITSQAYNTEFDFYINEWQSAGLLSPSFIRIHKIQTLHSSLVFGNIGRLTNADLKPVKRSLGKLVINL
ncbi:MAG: type II toxin-antitoxin system PemK/MazF family toxin [Chitinophagaceae bacterium]